MPFSPKRDQEGDKSRNSNAFVILESRMSFSSLVKFFDMTDKDPTHSNNLLSDALSAKSRAMICSISSKYENLCDDSDPSLLSFVQYIVSDTFSAWS